MAWGNPPVPWRDLEATLSDRNAPDRTASDRSRAPDRPEGADGGDSPAWSNKRSAYEAPALVRGTSATPYAELHCHSCFSFLDGASHPEQLAEEAARLGLEALAITDHDGFYGVVRFAEAAREVGLPTVFGAELTLDKLDITPGQADPDGGHLLMLARDPAGYAALARVISESQLAGEKGAPRASMGDVERWLRPDEVDHLVVLTGCRKGAVPRALEREGPAAAERELRGLIDRFGQHNVFVELWDHGFPVDSVRNDAMVALAANTGVDIIATNNVHYAAPSDRKLAAAMAAVRSRRSLDEIEGWLPAAGLAHLRSGDEQARRFARYPGVVERAAALGLECAFDLSLVAPNLPPFPCPPDPNDAAGAPMSEMAYLRHLVEEAGVHRYGTRDAEWVPGAWKQLDHELDLIEALGFPGYFLVVWDIVEFCRKADILCQGRGSAANSAVCYVLGVTKADAVSLGLLFERFLAPERDGPPDIDLDIESDRREEAIQYVYERHGRRHAAQVANVITYRSRSAVRDAAKALGFAPGQQDAFSKTIDRWSSLKHQVDSSSVRGPGRVNVPTSVGGESFNNPAVPPAVVGPTSTPAPEPRRAGETPELPDEVVDLAAQFEHLPRHLGIHSGGMVMCDRPVIEVCPVEWGRMADRTVLQWDKDDCAAAGLVKFDLLGLGMLSALHYCVDMVAEHHETKIDLAALGQEDAVYDMLCAADSVGVFQVESRAQMSTLPRLRPRTFYDLVVEIALIRPGPIQGGSVHPYIRRRNGQEPVTYLHPLLENALEKTLGIPLFQEQLMQMAIDISGFTPAEADELRRAMGSKRSRSRMERLRERLEAGMTERGVTPDIQEQIWNKLVAFANYGFPESHSISFAYLVYASSWLKLHYPAAFCAALLNAQPMGFYSPHSLVQDARRHGVPTLSPNVNASEAGAVLVPDEANESADLSVVVPGTDDAYAEMIERERLDHGWSVRLGIGSIRSIGEDHAEVIAANRPYASIEDLARRASLTKTQLEALATAGALEGLLESRMGGAPAGGLSPAKQQSAAQRSEAAAPVAPGWAAPQAGDYPRRSNRAGESRMGGAPGGGLSPPKQKSEAAKSERSSGADETRMGGAPGGGLSPPKQQSRRQALWTAGAVAESSDAKLPGIITGVEAPQLPGMSEREESLADLWATGVAPDGHPTVFLRERLDEMGVVPAAGLAALEDGSKVLVAGIITHRQRPATASGVTFIGMEDETGLINVVVSVGCWARYRKTVRTAPALLVRGRCERQGAVVNIAAERLDPLPVDTGSMSRDFR